MTDPTIQDDYLDLLQQCVDEYWHHNDATLDASSRMSAVFRLIAANIKCWAPSKSDAKITYLAINEVADRLLYIADGNQ